MCSRLIKLFVLFVIVESIYCTSRASNDCNNKTSNSYRSTLANKKRKILSDVNAYLTGDLSEEEQLLDPWALFRNYELGEFTEGDLRIPAEESNRRTFLKKAKFWKEGIVPFFVNDIIKNDNHALTVLLNAMRTISIATNNCVQFIPIDKNQIRTYPQLPFLNITGDEQGCFADIGQSNYENIQSQINLNINQCFLLPGNSLHELLHILGQTHEHMRPDRDQYIRIVWDNISPGSQSNFEILDYSDVENFNLPYDYESVTHYSRTAFTVDSTLATIVPLNKTTTIGQRTHLSEIDKKKLNLQYACPKNRKRYKFVDILKLYNITANNKTINDHMHEIELGDHSPEQNKSNTLNSGQLQPPNIHLESSNINLPFTTTYSSTIKFTPTQTTQVSLTTTPSNYETGFPFFANLLETFRKNPFASISINGIPYNQNQLPQTNLPNYSKYIYPTYPSIYNPYVRGYSTEYNPIKDLTKFFNSISPSKNIPYTPYQNIPINDYQTPLFRYGSNLNTIPPTYEPWTTPYESLLYKSPASSRLNHYKPINYKTPTFQHNQYRSNFYKPNNDKTPNSDNFLPKLTTLKHVSTKPEISNKTRDQPNPSCNITSNSKGVIADPFFAFLRFINPILNSVKDNIKAFKLNPLNMNRGRFNRKIENIPYDDETIPKDSSAILPNVFYSKEHPLSHKNPENGIVIEPSEFQDYNWNRIPNQPINHPHVSGIIYPIRFNKNEYPPLNENPENHMKREPKRYNLFSIPNRQFKYPFVKGNTYPIRMINNELPLLNKNPDFASELILPNFNSISNFRNKYPPGSDNIYPIQINENTSSNKSPEDGIVMNPPKVKLNLNSTMVTKTFPPFPANINFIRYITDKYHPTRQISVGDNPLELKLPNLNRIPVILNNYPLMNEHINPINYIEIKNPSKETPEDGKFENSFLLKKNKPPFEFVEEMEANESKQPNVSLDFKALIKCLYPEMATKTSNIRTFPYESLALKSSNFNNENPPTKNDIDKDINEIIKVIKNGYPSMDLDNSINDIIKMYTIIKTGYPSTDKDIDDIIKMYQVIKTDYPSSNKDMDDIIKMYQIIKNAYPSPNKDIDDITKIYKILQSGSPPPDRLNNGNEKDSGQSVLLQKPNYNFIPSNVAKTRSKLRSSPINENEQTSINPHENTRTKLGNIPSENSAREYFIKNFKMNPHESKLPVFKITTTHYDQNTGDTRLSTNNFKMNPNKFDSSNLTPEEYNQLIKVLAASINNNGFPKNIPVDYKRLIENLDPSIFDDIASKPIRSEVTYAPIDVESNSSPSSSSMKKDDSVTKSPSKSKFPDLSFIIPGYTPLHKSLHQSNNNADYFVINPQKPQTIIKLEQKPDNPLRNNDSIEKPCKSSNNNQNSKTLNPLSDDNNQNNPNTPSLFRIRIPSNHNPTAHKIQNIIKTVFNPRKTNDASHSNNDGINPIQEQFQLSYQPDVFSYPTPLLKDVQQPLSRSNWLEYYIALCIKNKKEQLSDFIGSNLPYSYE